MSLLQIDGIGDTQIISIKSFFSNETNLRITEDLINVLEISEYQNKSQDGILSNKTIMFTGGFKDMSRSEAKSIVENNGGKVLSTVTKKLNYLVVGDSNPTKRKIDQAKDLNIKILFEKDWKKILNS